MKVFLQTTITYNAPIAHNKDNIVYAIPQATLITNAEDNFSKNVIAFRTACYKQQLLDQHIQNNEQVSKILITASYKTGNFHILF